ncbi:MAG: hypothetical protein ACE5F9_06915 [Phycisphaerae bacterium]
MALIAETDWLSSLQELIRYYVPAVEASPGLTAGSLVAVAIGILMALRSAKLLRALVTCFGLVLGTWLGIEVARLIGTPMPITAAVCAVAISLLAYRTHKGWLASGSVLALLCLALCYQLGRGDLTRYLKDPKAVVAEVRLPSPQQQERNWPDRSELLQDVGGRVMDELKSMGPIGWVLPLVAAVVGGILAWKALPVFAVVWMGLLGSIVAVSGGATFLCAQWPALRSPMTEHPQLVAGAAAILWIGGLILQAREARFPGSGAKPPPKGGSASS